MNYLDIILCIPLLWGLYKGVKKGLVIEVASLVALGLGIFGAVKFSDVVAGYLQRQFEMTTEYLPVIAFSVTFILIVVGVFALAKALEKIVNIAQLKLANKLAGAAFGTLKVALILSILLVVLSSIDSNSIVINKETKEASLLYSPVYQTAPTVIPAVKKSELYQLVSHTPSPPDSLNPR